jgi:hypothetical protein
MGGRYPPCGDGYMGRPRQCLAKSLVGEAMKIAAGFMQFSADAGLPCSETFVWWFVGGSIGGR